MSIKRLMTKLVKIASDQGVSVRFEFDKNDPGNPLYVIGLFPDSMTLNAIAEFLVEAQAFSKYHSYDDFSGKLAAKVLKHNGLRVVFDPL